MSRNKNKLLITKRPAAGGWRLAAGGWLIV
jgi:hypothetical protein